MSFCRWKPVSQGHTAGGQRALYLPLSQWAASARPRVDARSVPCLPGWPWCVALQHGSFLLLEMPGLPPPTPRTPQSRHPGSRPQDRMLVDRMLVFLWTSPRGDTRNRGQQWHLERGLGKGVGRILFWLECLLCVCHPSTCAASEPRVASPAGQRGPVGDQLPAHPLPSHRHRAAARGAPLPVPDAGGEADPCAAGRGVCGGGR